MQYPRIYWATSFKTDLIFTSSPHTTSKKDTSRLLKKYESLVVDAPFRILQTSSSSTKPGNVLGINKSYLDMMASMTKSKEKGKRTKSNKTSRSILMVPSSSWDELENFLVKIWDFFSSIALHYFNL